MFGPGPETPVHADHVLVCGRWWMWEARGVATKLASRPFVTREGVRLEVVEIADEAPAATVYVAPGITGMNVDTDRDVLDVLARGRRVVVVFPRGTGRSEGRRGDVDVGRFVADFVEGVGEPSRPWFFFGHSMAGAVALAAARRAPPTGLVLVSPPLRRKAAPGMSPTFREYLRYAAYMVFRPRTAVVNMAGDPARIADPRERAEAAARLADPLLVTHFSLRTMLGVQRLIAAMPQHARALRSPLLLVHGTADGVADVAGSEALLAAWAGPDRQLHRVEGGPHGKDTILGAASVIDAWLRERS